MALPNNMATAKEMSDKSEHERFCNIFLAYPEYLQSENLTKMVVDFNAERRAVIEIIKMQREMSKLKRPDAKLLLATSTTSALEMLICVRDKCGTEVPTAEYLNKIIHLMKSDNFTEALECMYKLKWEYVNSLMLQALNAKINKQKTTFYDDLLSLASRLDGRLV